MFNDHNKNEGAEDKVTSSKEPEDDLLTNSISTLFNIITWMFSSGKSPSSSNDDGSSSGEDNDSELSDSVNFANQDRVQVQARADSSWWWPGSGNNVNNIDKKEKMTSKSDGLYYFLCH